MGGGRKSKDESINNSKRKVSDFDSIYYTISNFV